MVPHQEQIYMQDLLSHKLKTEINQFDIHYTSGIIRQDPHYGYHWWIYPPYNFPWEMLDYKTEEFWFRLGPYTYTESSIICKQMDNNISNCVKYFNNITFEVDNDS